jgi:hypothetical protein
MLCFKKNVCAIFLKCFPKDDEPSLFENCLKRRMKACEKKGCILVSIGLGSKLK